jgi:lysozyme
VLVSFDFNTGALHKSTLLKKPNTGDYDAVPKKSKGLVNRRSAEAGLWAKAEFVASNTVAVTKTVNKKAVVVDSSKLMPIQAVFRYVLHAPPIPQAAS